MKNFRDEWRESEQRDRDWRWLNIASKGLAFWLWLPVILVIGGIVYWVWGGPK